jgi:hypothetical protein
MWRRTLSRLALTLSAVFLALPATALAGGRVASATGFRDVQGRPTYVDVVAAVPAGQSARQATDAALRQQGAVRSARPHQGSGSYAFDGLVWDVLPVDQYYNPSGQPLPAQAALQASENTWSSIPGSRYRIENPGTTTRCPSLTQGCKGRQSYDGFNDVGWARLGGTTLAVTWYGTSTDEADMAVNSRFRWDVVCSPTPDPSNTYSVRSVMLHENGHVAGLDHVNDPDQIMYPSYRGPRCTLGSGDQAGIRTLYP